MKKLHTFLKDTPTIKSLKHLLKSKDTLVIDQVNDQVLMPFLSSTSYLTQRPLIIVVPSLFKAKTLLEEMEKVIDHAFLYPTDDVPSTAMLASGHDLESIRLHTINQSTQMTHPIIITTMSGFTKPLMPFKRYKEALKKIRLRDEITIRAFKEHLVYLGYTSSYTVEEEGTFHHRGDRVDVFPHGFKLPYRIEWFDDEIESIRTFDPVKQTTIKKVSSLSLTPVQEWLYDEQDLQTLEKTISSILLDEHSRSRVNDELSSLFRHEDTARLSHYGTLLYQPSTLSDYFQDPMVLFLEKEELNEQFSRIVWDVENWYDNTRSYPKIGFKLVVDHLTIHNEKTIELHYFTVDHADMSLHGSSPTVYNGDVKALAKDIDAYAGKKTVVIGGLTTHQIDMLQEQTKTPLRVLKSYSDILVNSVNITEERVFSIDWYDVDLYAIDASFIYHQKKKQSQILKQFRNTSSIKSLKDVKTGDFIVHKDHGIGKYLGVKTIELGDLKNDYLHIAYAGDDTLYIPIDKIHLIRKYIATDMGRVKVHNLNGKEWAKTKLKVSKRVKDIADDLIRLYAAREQANGYAFSKDNEMMRDFEATFEYEETPDQLSAIEDIKADMEKPIPMDRLLCGDVGYGKTEVALRAAFKAVLDQKQVVYLAPTTVLARQHFYTFKNRLDSFGVNVRLLSRFVTQKEQSQTIKDLETGLVDIVIGTHRVLSKDLKYHDLGLLIIDEEQRFGVEHKETIKQLKVSIDVLSLSATPIPRTLQMAMLGVKSMSLLETPPLNRYPIQTYVSSRQDGLIKDAIYRELAREGQVFYLYNKVEDIELIVAKLSQLVPEARIAYAHGKMNRLQLENVLAKFIDDEYDVLVSTTIIETGIDIPNANTLVIHNADHLGLSQLYQIRGRVGRSDRIAYAYLMYEPFKSLNDEAVKRLQAITEFTELGSGFEIARRDLSIRGAGDLLGRNQSGFIDAVGLDMYLELLHDEIEKGQGNSVKEDEVDIHIPISKNMPADYLDSESLRIEYHEKFMAITTLEDVERLKEELTDRFGDVPKDLETYMLERFSDYKLKKLGIERVNVYEKYVQFVFGEAASIKLNGSRFFALTTPFKDRASLDYKDKQIHLNITKMGLVHYVDILSQIISKL